MGSIDSVAWTACDLLGRLVAPSRCSACDERVAHRAAFCPPCASTIDRTGAAESGLFAAFTYGGAIALAIVRLKYHRRPDLARPLGDLLWQAIRPGVSALQRPVVVVPVPLHPVRLADRGYNQSALLGRRVARGLGAPLWPRALTRDRNTPAQAALDRHARASNLADAFRVRCPEEVRRQSILLVDDVCTTGATLRACTRALIAAGATSVAHAVVARAQAEV